MSASSITAQRGAALAISLIILVVLTLLGIAAMRSSRLELRLSQNAESRMLALESAQAVADGASNQTSTNLDISKGPGFISCFAASGTVNGVSQAPANNPTLGANDCTSSSLTLTFPSGMSNYGFAYAEVKRDTPEFVTVNSLRNAGVSGRNYDFARFLVTGGYDNSANGQGAAEVDQGTQKLHAKAQGVTYQ